MEVLVEMVEEKFINKIKAIIEVIRPMIQQDGGDIFYRNFSEETNVLEVELVGNCVSCPVSSATLKGGVERIMQDRVDSKIIVENIGEEWVPETVVSIA